MGCTACPANTDLVNLASQACLKQAWAAHKAFLITSLIHSAEAANGATKNLFNPERTFYIRANGESLNVLLSPRRPKRTEQTVNNECFFDSLWTNKCCQGGTLKFEWV